MLFSEMMEKRVVVPDTCLMHLNNLTIMQKENVKGYVVVHLLEEGSSITFTPNEFGTAFNIIFSSEFVDYCRLVNDCANALYERENKREELADFISGFRDYMDDDRDAYTIIHEYDVACTELSTLAEARIEDKNALIEQYGWSTWVDVCRLYECIFEVKRENI